MFAADLTRMLLYLSTSENRNDEVTGSWHRLGERNEFEKP